MSSRRLLFPAGRYESRSRSRRLDPVAERALRAARVDEAPPEWQAKRTNRLFWWLLGRVLAISLLGGSAWLVYDSASSDRFQVRSVVVSGTALLDRTEVESLAAINGANVFWVRPQDVEARLKTLAAVRRVQVAPQLPDRVEITVVEREPAAFWLSGGNTYLVDGEGMVLKALPNDTAAAPVACGGRACDLSRSPLPTVYLSENGPLAPGQKVDVRALAASTRLQSLLPSAGVAAERFEWSQSTGLEVITREGWRARFDGASDLATQLRSLAVLRTEAARRGIAAELFDVRFGDRPIFR